MTGPSLGGPQFFLKEVWEGGTPLKAGLEGKIVHSAHDNEGRGHIWSPLPITRARMVTTPLSSYNSGVPPRHQLAYLVSTCDSGPTSGTTAVRVCEHHETTK